VEVGATAGVHVDLHVSLWTIHAAQNAPGSTEIIGAHWRSTIIYSSFTLILWTSLGSALSVSLVYRCMRYFLKSSDLGEAFGHISDLRNSKRFLILVLPVCDKTPFHDEEKTSGTPPYLHIYMATAIGANFKVENLLRESCCLGWRAQSRIRKVVVQLQEKALSITTSCDRITCIRNTR
jgi:hypothetical protein